MLEWLHGLLQGTLAKRLFVRLCCAAALWIGAAVFLSKQPLWLFVTTLSVGAVLLGVFLVIWLQHHIVSPLLQWRQKLHFLNQRFASRGVRRSKRFKPSNELQSLLFECQQLVKHINDLPPTQRARDADTVDQNMLEQKVAARTKSLLKINRKLREQLERQAMQAESAPATTQSSERYEDVPKNNPVLKIDLSGDITHVNDAGYALVKHLTDADSGQLAVKWLQQVRNCYQSHQDKSLEIEIADKWYLVSIVPMPGESCVNWYASDITERKFFERELQLSFTHDALTNLPIRTIFEDRLKQLLTQAKQDKTLTAVICFSVDNFKDINTCYGHYTGDQVLKAFIQRIRDKFPPDCVLGRLGGNKFALARTNLAEPASVTFTAQILFDAVKSEFKVDGQVIKITVSQGAACAPEDGAEPTILIKNADLAMYDARAQGKNKLAFFKRGMDDQARRRQSLFTHIHYALEQEQFSLVFQPQIDLQTLSITGVEALVRWNSDVFGTVSPEEFISIAEENGLIVELGQWILRAACQQAKAFHDEGFKLRMAVNLSAIQFHQPQLINDIKSVLCETQFPARYLELELTENVVMHDSSDVVATMEDITALGVNLAIDDFGTGYSSLSYLKRLPCHRIKIDKTFINNLHMDTHNLPIVESIMTLGQHYGMRTLAEGIESMEELSLLRSRGCHEGQGFFFSAPLKAEQLQEFIDSWPQFARKIALSLNPQPQVPTVQNAKQAVQRRQDRRRS